MPQAPIISTVSYSAGYGRLMLTPTRAGARLLVMLFMAVLLPSCANIPLPVGHGHIELDENTDPRFVKPDREGRIGFLQAMGNNVFLNQRPVSGKRSIKNGDSIRTGPGSRASIKFSGILSDKCPRGIRIEAFMTGRLYGKTHTCRHHLFTSNARITTEVEPSEYLVHTFPDFTELTIVKGPAYLSPLGEADVKIRVSNGHELRLEGSHIIGPRRLSPDEINERLDWTRAEVPELIGLNLREASLLLAKVGLKQGTVSNIASRDRKMAGRVAKQVPSPHSRVEYDTPVKLWLWNRAAQFVMVPRLIGLSPEETEKILTKTGLSTGTISILKNDGTHKPGIVQRQSPKDGSKVAPNSSVDIWIWDNFKSLRMRPPPTPIIK
jgi:hypothetical protein